MSLKDARRRRATNWWSALAGTKFENDWDVWVYPAQVGTESAGGCAIVTTNLTRPRWQRSIPAARCLLTIPPRQCHATFDSDPVKLGFSSIFWNTAWTGRQAPTTLGILCDPKHPAFAEFPTDYFSNWQWWYLVHRAGAMILDDLPRGPAPDRAGD